MSNRKYKRLQQGLTLLEVMIVSGLTIFIITSFTKLFIQYHRRLLKNQQVIAESLTAQKLMTLLQSEIAMSGQIGCARLSDDFIVQPYQQYSLTKLNSLQLSANELTVQYQSTPTILLQETKNSRSFITDNGATMQPDDIAVISDCEHAEIFQVKSVNHEQDKQHITTVNPLHFHFQAHAEIGKLIHHHYFLTQRNKENVLIREDLHGRREVYQRKINQLQFLFDGKGVEFYFQTPTWKWSAYAAKT